MGRCANPRARKPRRSPTRPKIIWMKENTPTIVEMMGAKIEITATAKNAFSYRIVEPMPMQPYGLEMRTTTSTRIIYY